MLQVNARFPERLRVIHGSSAVEWLLDITGVRDKLPIISNGTDPLDHTGWGDRLRCSQCSTAIW